MSLLPEVSGVCSASRAGAMTARFPERTEVRSEIARLDVFELAALQGHFADLYRLFETLEGPAYGARG
jgi:hypothetical protein